MVNKAILSGSFVVTGGHFSTPNDSLVTSLNNIAQSELSGLALWNMRNEIEKNQEISEKPFPCDFCDSRFKRLYDKNRHMKMAHLAHLEQTDQGEMIKCYVFV